MIVAVILSAGESSRMGRPKALLPIEGQKFIERIVGALRQSRVDRILVVLGHNADEMRREIEHLSVDILINPAYQSGQLSSLQVAIRHIQKNDDCDGMLVHLVDHPYIDAELVNLLIKRFEDGGKLIVVPRFRGKRGHPVIFASTARRNVAGAVMARPANWDCCFKRLSAATASRHWPQIFKWSSMASRSSALSSPSTRAVINSWASSQNMT